MRLDQWLVHHKHAKSRHRAAMLIKNGHVLVNGQVPKKNGVLITENDQVEIVQEDFPWVGRGALKLLHAIEKFQFPIEGKTFIDVGSSTGGFTEVLLAHHAKKVYAVDVGSNQLVDKIKADPKVVALEQTDIRNAQDRIQEPVDGIVIDVSFISLTQILQPVYAFLQNEGVCIALIKPQFEVQRAARNKKGVVKDPEKKKEVVDQVLLFAKNVGFKHQATTASPIQGGDGNEEFLVYLVK